ncbi:hypothetical protein U0C82_02450 [Fulvimarina sp. 2208YS6-2-32]|uniref:Uncharacterized protein n=1 Tax=Fulvimarina uroteuthidis TaxID=3098149 RepID=A0ABU5HYX3_9HYPH|nr:hypothetical protein [Fulvimarina sp. 2208YS6-2-32]MDY8108010.1 hypothetical protein [Fulvimarina sp. 2208YS6-2-32]
MSIVSRPGAFVRAAASFLGMALLALGVALGPALAQDAGKGGGGLFGGGGFGGLEGLFGGDEKPGPNVYVSPSAIELLPDAADVGVPQNRSLKTFDPIALPERASPRGTSALDLPNLPAYAPQLNVEPKAFRPNAELVLEARLVDDGEPVPNGLVWRLFSAVPQLDGRSALIATSKEAQPSFDVPPGAYIVHAIFGRAGIVKRIDFSGVSAKEVIVLGAGGLKLNATASADGAEVPKSRLRFDIYSDPELESDRELIASGVAAGETVRLNAGLYHVVSTYGSVNAQTQGDIKVEAGKLTEATLQHHASQQTLKLVREKGGEAIAGTAWTIASTSGDILRKSAGAFASMVLNEGDYTAIARNRDTTYQRTFTVKAGEDAEVEILLSDLAEADTGD